MLRNHVVNNVNVNLSISHLISHFSDNVCDVRVKYFNSEQTIILGYCGNAVAQYGHLFTSGLTLYI